MCSMSAAKRSTSEESRTFAAVFLLFAGAPFPLRVAVLFCAGAPQKSALSDWKEGRQAGGPSWASRANLTDRGMILQFMQASSVRASCRWSTPRQATQWSRPSSGSRGVIQLPPGVLHPQPGGEASEEPRKV